MEQSFLPTWVEHLTGARTEGCCVKPLSFGVACFYSILRNPMTNSILRNPMTIAGIATKPPRPVSPTFQPWGRTHKVSYTGPELLQEVPSTSRTPPSSGLPHTPLLLFPNTLMGILRRQMLVIPVQAGFTSRTLLPGSSCPDTNSLRKLACF